MLFTAVATPTAGWPLQDTTPGWRSPSMPWIRALFLACLAFAAVPADAALDFAKQILPVLQRACFECHGPDLQKAGLRLDAKAHAFTSGEHGPVIVPGKPDASELLRRVSLPRTNKAAMPRRGTPLTPAEIDSLRTWIAEGAVWPDEVTTARHWAYVKPVKAPAPAAKNTSWPRNEVDRFILARLEQEGLQPAKPADPATLARRVHLALTGLPPTPEQVSAFESAAAKDHQTAVESLVDRLLDSPEFGVRWARPWLDLARYADSHGFQRDDLREIWGFRDWVVNALNADMPFDQFTIEQVAGDLLPNATMDQIVATGFHRCTPTNVEAGTEPEESRINQVLDRVNTTGAVWLGSTLECAQCHNHKYDPFSQADYYSLMAYFNNTEKEAERANAKVPGSIAFIGSPYEMSGSTPSPERQKLESEKATIEARMAALKKDGDTAFEAWLEKMRAELAQPVAEHPLDVVEFVSENGASDRELEDGSILLSGETPDTDTYRLVLKGPALKNITVLKLDALTHESLPGTGPGRGAGDRPNFVLNTFEARLRAADANDDAGQPLKFTGATADFSQNRFDPEGAIDDDPETAWAINPQFGKDHWARFELETPLELAPRQELVVTLVQTFGGGRTLGRVRLSAITGSLAASTLPGPLAALIQRPRLNAKMLAQLREHFDLEMPGMAAMKKQMTGIEKKLASLKAPTSEVMKELPQPRVTAVFKRGVYTDPTTPVSAATPAVLPKTPGPANRLGLARWLVSKENPLTARVTVNRWWAELFGHGLVATVEDFGIKGAPPTHPELLDWLAVTFMENGWSMKKVLRLITTSATFGQDAALTPELIEKDAPNHLYARGPRFRLDAEGVRDNALAIAGLLSTEKGGPPIYPPQPDGLWRKVGGQNYNYVVSPGEKKYRRGLYVVLKRGAPNPSFVNFDASARMACVVKRSRSNTPLQALTLLNDPVYVEAAQAFAARVLKEKPDAPLADQITHAFRLAVARTPTPAELSVLTDLHQTQRDNGADASAAWYALTTALLNLDECITKS
jgi:mono/diheme cytochrome c family protein